MFDRSEKLIGNDNLHLISQKKVLLVGLGGVGGSAMLSLVRSGITKLIIADFDTIDITNLNRQEISFINNIGSKKVYEASALGSRINPNCHIKEYDMFLNKDNISKILDDDNPDYIIDACDSIDTKKTLILEANKRNIKIISSMGTGYKLDPTKLQITTLDKTINDPLAKIMRKWAKDNKLNKKVTVVSSTEVPIKKGVEIASMSFVPNVAGILLANYVIRDIIKK